MHGSIFKKCKIKFVPTIITGGRMSQHIGKGVDFNITNKLKCFQKHKCFIYDIPYMHLGICKFFVVLTVEILWPSMGFKV